MAKKIKVAILFGGRSSEHSISLLSAKNVIDALDKTKFEPVLVGIDKTGTWHFNEGAMKIIHGDDARKITIDGLNEPIIFSQNMNEHALVSKDRQSVLANVDVIFPVLHGTYGEDGSVQGLAKLANLPCVGCGILGSAIGMDKDVTKRLLRDAGIRVADFITLRKSYNENISYKEVSDKLGETVFIKPANLGSSVGVSMARNEEEYVNGVKAAFEYDPKVIIEEKISGREIECAVMGNESPKASTIGEVVPDQEEWYDFESKYVSQDGARVVIPADLSANEMEDARNLAIEVYRCLECEGLTRVDMFLQEDGTLIVNEINTIPGFTKISMYPKLWEASGLGYTDLISQLIQYAIDSHDNRSRLRN